VGILQWLAVGLASLGLLLPAQPARAALDLALWDALLAEAVEDGRVDYSKWMDGPRLDALVAQVGSADTRAMDRAEQLAFYINAYNILAVKGILEGGSPKTLLGRYEYFKRDKYLIAGERLNLFDLENDRIRPLGEPRIHFAIVCASSSCPVLRDEAYRADTLDSQLEDAARGFINDPGRNRFDAAGGKAGISKIFKWFDQDFAASAGSVQAYLANYVRDDAARELLARGAFRIRYLAYDWHLNGSL
jgi:hypothetical protein